MARLVGKVEYATANGDERRKVGQDRKFKDFSAITSAFDWRTLVK
jgi:hypothetical protein